MKRRQLNLEIARQPGPPRAIRGYLTDGGRRAPSGLEQAVHRWGRSTPAIIKNREDGLEWNK